MALNTDSYREAMALRIVQMTDPTLSDEAKLGVADVLRWQASTVLDEVDRLRAENDKLLRLARSVADEKAQARAMDKAGTDGQYIAAQIRYNRAVMATAAALAALEVPHD
jgi:hypothetical protein